MKKHYLNTAAAHFPVIAIGFSAIVAQMIFMRELLIVFYGNELSLGIMLAVWLLFTALGSVLVPKIIFQRLSPRFKLGFFQLVCAGMLPAILFLIKTIRPLMGITSGEMTGSFQVILISTITLAPFCICSGFLYTAACQWHAGISGSRSYTIGRVYLLEAFGSGLGGLATGFIFIPLFNAAAILWLLATANLMSVWLLFAAKTPSPRKTGMAGLFLILSGISTAGFLFSHRYQVFCDRTAWKGLNLIGSRNTIYGNLAVTKTEGQYSFFQNGLHAFTVPDPLSAEESLHYALLQHPHPERILLIGNGLGGKIREGLKYGSVQRIDYIELDPEIVRMARQLLPAEFTRILNSDRLQIVFTDGRRYIQETKNKYDVILLDLPDPYTAQLNRFYTYEFFKAASSRLNENGVCVFKVTASENMIGPELADLLSVLYATFSRVFKQIVLIPGETVRFIGTQKQGFITADPDQLIRRLNANELKTRYFREYYLPYQLSKERRDYLKSKIHSVTDKNINHDLKPVGYYYDAVLWATYFSSVFKKLFLVFSRLHPQYIYIITVVSTLFLACIAIYIKYENKRTRLAVQYSIYNTGFAEMSIEIILLLVFQTFYGNIYHLLIFILTSTMLGLSCGSLIGNKQRSVKSSLRHFQILQLLMTVYPLLLMLLFITLVHSASIPANGFFTGMFMILAFIAGFIGGYQFPIANRIMMASEKTLSDTAGALYALDLTGSAFGAFFISVFMIPLYGVLPALLLLSVMNAGAFVFVCLWMRPAIQ